MSNPAVSILMSVRNAQRTLPLALTSLRAQTLADWELLVADDGSTDATAPLLEQAARMDRRIRLHPDRGRRGLAARLNQLVREARAPLAARMDADDVCYPDRLAHQMSFMTTHPEVDLLGTSMVVFGDDGVARSLRCAPAEHTEICSRPARGFPLFHPTWMGQTRWFRSHPYAIEAHRCEDQDLLFRTYRTSRFANLEQPLFGYREDHLILRNLIEGRRSMASRFGRQLWREHRPLAAVGVVSEQLLKGLIDAAAVSAGAERILRRRSVPLRSQDAADWLRIWGDLNVLTATPLRPGS